MLEHLVVVPLRLLLVIAVTLPKLLEVFFADVFEI